jgi:DNA-binding MarR family transcriptional regulator
MVGFGSMEKNNPALFPENQVEELNILVHALINAVRFPGAWSGMLNNIPPVDLQLMGLVWLKPDIIIKELRDIMDLPGSTVTSSINRLVHRGWIRRVKSKRDRRSYGLELTDAGKAIQREHDRVDRVISANILNSLQNGEERTLLIDLLTEAVSHLEGSYYRELSSWLAARRKSSSPVEDS